MTRITIRRAEAEDTERLNEALSYLSGEIGDDHGGTAELLRKAGFGDYPAFRALLAEDGYHPGIKGYQAMATALAPALAARLLTWKETQGGVG